MKKFIYLLLLCVLSVNFSFAQAEGDNDLIRKVDQFWNSGRLSKISSYIPPAWNWPRVDTIGFHFSNSEPVFIEIYKTDLKNIPYLSVINFNEDNFIMYQSPMTHDNITGELTYEKERRLEWCHGNRDIWAKRTVGNTVVQMDNKKVQVIIGGEMPLSIQLPRDEVFINFDELNSKSNIYAWLNRSIRQMAQKYAEKHKVPQYASEKQYAQYYSKLCEELSNKVNIFSPFDDKMSITMPVYPTSNINEIEIGFMGNNKSELYYLGSEGFVKRVYLPVPRTVSSPLIQDWVTNNYIEIKPSDVVRNIEKNGNVFTIYLNDDDFLKYSAYSNVIFEGKVKRKDGIFEINLGNKSPKEDYFYGKLTYGKDTPTLYYIDYYSFGGETEIPAGSYFVTSFPNSILYNDYPTEYILGGKGSPKLVGKMYNTKGEETFNFIEGALIWNEGKSVRAKEEAKAKKELAAKEKPVYNALCAKYGKKYVDAAKNGDIVIGMPINLIKEVFECSLWHNYDDTYKSYEVEVRPAIYVENLNKISAKREANFFYPFKKLIVSTTNGRVSSFTYY